MDESHADHEPPAGPPWIDPTIQQRVEWRDGGIVVSVPLKSGTTWMMNIVHQLRAGGDADCEWLYRGGPFPPSPPGPGVSGRGTPVSPPT